MPDATLTASMLLKLDDQLSSPLDRVMSVIDKFSAVVDRLGEVADRLNFDGVGTKATKAFDAATKAAEEAAHAIWTMTEPIDAVERRSSGLIDRMRELGEAGMGAARGAWGAVSGAGRQVGGAAHKFSEAGSSLINKGFGAAVEGFAVYEPAKKYAEWDDILRTIGITQGLHGDALQARMAHLGDFFRTDALATGQTSEAIAHAFLDLVGQGFKGDFIERALRSHSMAATAYGITPEAMGQVVGSLFGSMGLAPEQLGGALASMAKAAQSGKFSVSDFSQEMPGIFGAMSLLGMKGRVGADIGFATAEIVRQFTGQSGAAGADLYDALRYITSPIAIRSFAKKGGVDLPALLRRGEKAGITPLDTIVDKLREMTKGLSPVDQGIELGKLLHNQQAGLAIQALIVHHDQWRALRKQLSGVDELKLNIDFAERLNAPDYQLKNLSEGFTQLDEVMGKGFMPVLTAITRGVLWLTRAMEGLEKSHPALLTGILSVLAAMLAFGAALTLVGAVLPLLTTGFGLLTTVLRVLFNPISLVLGLLALLGAAAYDIYAHWSRFSGLFSALWGGIKQIFSGSLDAILGLLTGNAPLMMAGAEKITKGMNDAFSAGWRIIKQLFIDFGAWIDSWSGGLATRVSHAIAGAFDALKPHVYMKLYEPGSVLDRLFGAHDQVQQKAGALGAPGALAPPTHHIALHVSTDPGVHVSGVRSTSPATTVTSGTSRGRMLNVP